MQSDIWGENKTRVFSEFTSPVSSLYSLNAVQSAFALAYKFSNDNCFILYDMKYL